MQNRVKLPRMVPLLPPQFSLRARFSVAAACVCLWLGVHVASAAEGGRVAPDTIAQVDGLVAHLRSTPQWQPYWQNCQPELNDLSRWSRDRLNTYLRAPGMFRVIPQTIRLAMLVGASGHVAKVICEPRSELGADVAAQAATLQFPPPPSPGWPVRVTWRPRAVYRHTNRGGADIGFGR